MNGWPFWSAGGATRCHGAHHRRERHGEGAAGRSAGARLAARRQAVRALQLCGALTRAGRGGALRPRRAVPSPARSVAAGLFREADGGTILLDEVGELDGGGAGEAAPRPSGGRGAARGRGPHPTMSTSGYLAATNRDLSSLVAAQRFQRGLLLSAQGSPRCKCRPCASVPRISPCWRAISCRARRNGSEWPRPGSPPSCSAPTGSAGIPWPGNVRELENALESAVALSADGTINLSLLPDPSLPPQPQPAPTRFKEQVAAYERGLIVAALDATRGNQSEAARLLDIGRATLQDRDPQVRTLARARARRRTILVPLHGGFDQFT